MLKASDVHNFVFINDNLSMQTLVIEETINTMAFIEYLTWKTTVFSLNVIELESLFSTFFRSEGWLHNYFFFYIITATHNNSAIAATQR